MLYVDGHTHLHDHVAVEKFLNSAGASFCRHSTTANTKQVNGVLCLADFQGAEGFKRLGMPGMADELNNWKIITTAEKHSLLFKGATGQKIWIIAGRQIVTREKLEVMALGTIDHIPGKLSLTTTIDAVEQSAALPVLPWGVGKWLGGRGSMVKKVLERYGKRLVLCDNGGRPWFWRPRIFSQARQKGVAVISGTDPLRISSDCLRVGSFVRVFSGEIDQDFPAAWTKNTIRTEGAESTQMGVPMNNTGFLTKQLMLRFEIGDEK